MKQTDRDEAAEALEDVELWLLARGRVNKACLELRDVCSKFGMNHTADEIIRMNREILNLIHQECGLGD